MAQYGGISGARQQAEKRILDKPNVVGVGIGFKQVGGLLTDQISIVVLVRDKVPRAGLSANDMVPAQVDSIPTDVVEVGVLRALQARTDRWRPAPGGVSIAHYKVTAGTLGAVVRDRTTGQRLILSNNHVLANSNDAMPGDPILQPGPIDGGTQPADVIARLERFIPITFSVSPGTCSAADAYAMLGNLAARLVGSSHRLATFKMQAEATNEVDAAVARPENDANVLDEILDIGTVAGTVDPALGMAVTKSGRTTGHTNGTVTVLEATVDVSYGIGQTARFVNQAVTTPMSEGGDSGSLVVSVETQQATGLLFAGSSQATIFSPIRAVLDALEITI